MKNLISKAWVLILIMAILNGCTTNSAVTPSSANPANPATAAPTLSTTPAPSTDKEFKRAGITITLPNHFIDYTGKDEVAGKEAAFFSEKENVIVTVTNDTFTTIEEFGMSRDISLAEYGQVILNLENRSSDIEESNGLTHFTYNTDDNTYYSVVYKGPDAFWIVQFSCFNDDFSKFSDMFIQWAKSVSVGTSHSGTLEMITDALESTPKPSLELGIARKKEFSNAGASITLTENFVDMSGEEGFDNYIASYGSEKDAVFVLFLKEDFSLFESVGVPTDISLRDYAQMSLTMAERDETIYEDDSLTYYSYTSGDFRYFTSVYRGSDAYWMVQFGCYSEDWDGLLGSFLSWSKSVVV